MRNQALQARGAGAGPWQKIPCLEWPLALGAERQRLQPRAAPPPHKAGKEVRKGVLNSWGQESLMASARTSSGWGAPPGEGKGLRESRGCLVVLGRLPPPLALPIAPSGVETGGQQSDSAEHCSFLLW